MENASKYLEWKITEKGARITGCDKTFEGDMEIPSTLDGVPVVEIGEEAFFDCNRLVSVEVVGELAFANCSELEELRLGAGIKKIEKGAFVLCSSLNP